MKQHIRKWIGIIWILAVIPLTLACNKSAAVDNSTDSGGIFDTGPDGDADSDTDTDSDGDTDSDTGTATQEPILFKLKNQTNETLYVSRQEMQGVPFECGQQDGGEWVRCEFIIPWEQFSCAQIEEKGNGACTTDIGYHPMLTLIEPNGEFSFLWDGLLRKSHKGFPCMDDGACFNTVNPAPGRYRIVVRAWSDYTCWEAGCEDPVDGVIYGAKHVGEPTLYELEFDIVYPEKELIIVMEKKKNGSDPDN